MSERIQALILLAHGYHDWRSAKHFIACLSAGARAMLYGSYADYSEPPMNRRTIAIGALLLVGASAVFTLNVHAQNARVIATKSFPSVVLLLMEDSQGQPVSLGSGFFVDGGYVATNAHVLRGASRGNVKLVGKPEKGEIVAIAGVDASRDLVVLAVKGITGPPLPISKSRQVAVGEEVYAIGNPQGLEGTISQGIVSGVRNVGGTDVLQITAPISPGSSGGPVLDQKGQVVGVAVATFRSGQNLNFAIPTEYLAALLSQPRASLPLASLKASKESKSVLNDMGPKATEGVTSSAILCTDPPGVVNCTWSLVNKLRSPVRDVRHLVILWSKNGEPLDAQERHYKGVIQPGLAVRFPGYIVVSAELKRITSKIEVRILDFVVEE